MTDEIFDSGDHVQWLDRKTIRQGRVVLTGIYGKNKEPSAWVRLGTHGLDRTWQWVSLEKLSKVEEQHDD